MRRVTVLVEGRTEAAFIELLAGRLASSITPIIVETSREKNGRRHRGGLTSWAKAKRQLLKLLGDRGAQVTTMFDFYALPDDAPGMSNRPHAPAHEQVAHVERAIAADLADARFRPYLALHELESMLFTDLRRWEYHFGAGSLDGLAADVRGLRPEEINQTLAGAPSRRIARHVPDYDKVRYGPLACEDIGIDAIRAACPHFAAWLAWLESL